MHDSNDMDIKLNSEGSESIDLLFNVNIKGAPFELLCSTLEFLSAILHNISHCGTGAKIHGNMANLSSMTVIVALLLCCSMYSSTGQEAGVVQQSERMIQSLYNSIRAIAFPSSPQFDPDKTHQDTRFILMIPGKTLNYFDYYPGKEYTEFIQVCINIVTCNNYYDM